MVAIQYFDDPIASAEQRGEQEVWVQAGDRYAKITPAADTQVAFTTEKVDATPQQILERRGWRLVPPSDLGMGGTTLGLTDTYHRRHSKVWRYWITTPSAQLQGVRDFVAAAERGRLPDSLAEQSAEDGTGTTYTVCSFSLTMDQARALGAEQSALLSGVTGLDSLPDGMHFFQAVAQIAGLSGVEKQSHQPDTLPTSLYEPGTLFQTSDPDAAAARGSEWTETDVLSVTGLTHT